MRAVLRVLGAIVFLVLGFLVIALCDPKAAHAEWSIAEMNRQIDQTNFMVNQGCSGTLISLDPGLVLTANHCITNQYETIERETVGDDGVVKRDKVRRLKPGTVTQIFFDGASEARRVVYRTKVKALDQGRDLALLQVTAKLPNTRVSKLSCSEPGRGDRVYIVGNPMGVLYSSVVPGMITSVQRDYDLLGLGDDTGDFGSSTEPLLQISGGVVGGNSGGSLYNDAGELIGVPVRASRINEVLGFAVPLGSIKEFLKGQGLDTLAGGGCMLDVIR